MSTFLILIPCLSIIFMIMNHPLSMSLVLLVQTTVIAIQSGLINFNMWFSYIMFLIMIGGMLVLFIYMTSVASNEKFSPSPRLIMSYLLLMAVLMVIGPVSDFFPMETLSNLWNQNMFTSLTKYLNFPNNKHSTMVVTLMIYLLVALIAIVKICNIKNGPLRQKF